MQATPGLHLIRFHGVLAPNAKLRPLAGPQGPAAHEQPTAVAAASECETEKVQARPHCISWTQLLKRVFDTDMQHRPNCGSGELKIIAAILERPAIEQGGASLKPGWAAKRPLEILILPSAIHHPPSARP